MDLLSLLKLIPLVLLSLYLKPNFNFGASMAANRPWLVVDAIFVHGSQHPLPKHPEKILPKFDLDGDVLLENRIKKFTLSLILMNVEHHDVVCEFFAYNLIGKAPTWFFNPS